MGFNRTISRRQHRKLVFQLLVFSSLYLSCTLPYALVISVQAVAGLPDFGAYLENVYFYYLFGLMILLQPFVCIGCLPEVVSKIKPWWQRRLRRNIMVVPVNTSGP
jgi:hypothetical protein